MSHFLHKALLIIAASVLAATTAFAQTPQTTAQTEISPGASQPAPATVAQPAYLTPIAGYQGVLAETVEGSTVAAQAADDKFNPASAVKLATALVALQSFGPEHRFMTGLWTSGV